MVIRRGAALLLVLIIVAVGASAIVAAAVVSSTARTKHAVAQATELLDDLLYACEEPIMWFLENVADEVALPPDAPAPEVLVLHDRVEGERSIEVRITAWDQCGMAPWSIARSASPLRSAVPSEILWMLDSFSLADTVKGLDLITPSYEVAVFPAASDNGHEQELTSDMPPAFGAFIATHHDHGAARGLININTAPEPLLRAAMRAAGQGGIEAIMQSRERGEHVQIGEAAVPSSAAAPQIVSRSDGWAFRIDLRMDRVGRSWWVVYRQKPVEQEEGSVLEWKLVQRLLIPDGPAFIGGDTVRGEGEGSNSR